MCEVGAILNQYKGMASGDWAAVSDNLTRELLVIAVESPEARKTIQDVYAASKCVAAAVGESGLIEEGEEENAENDKENDEENEFWESFAADSTEKSDADKASELGGKSAKCVESVDRYQVGKITGRLAAVFYDNELKANV